MNLPLCEVCGEQFKYKTIYGFHDDEAIDVVYCYDCERSIPDSYIEVLQELQEEVEILNLNL